MTIESKDTKYYLFFCLWLILSLATYIQIIPLNITIAERWFYITFPALIGIIGIGVKYLHPQIKKYKNHLLIIYFVILLLFSLRTFVRGFDWQSDQALFTHDRELQPDNFFVIASLINVYLNNENYSMAIPYLKQYLEKNPQNGNSHNSLGYAYQMLEQYDKAIEAYKKALKPNVKFKDQESEIYPYLNLANCYITVNRPKDAITLLSDSVLLKYKNRDLYILRATARASVEDYEGALKDAEYVYINSYDIKAIYFYQRIKNEKEQFEKNNQL